MTASYQTQKKNKVTNIAPLFKWRGLVSNPCPFVSNPKMSLNRWFNHQNYKSDGLNYKLKRQQRDPMNFVFTDLDYALMWVIIFLMCAHILHWLWKTFSPTSHFSSLTQFSNFLLLTYCRSISLTHIYIYIYIETYYVSCMCMLKLCIMHVLCYWQGVMYV